MTNPAIAITGRVLRISCRRTLLSSLCFSLVATLLTLAAPSGLSAQSKGRIAPEPPSRPGAADLIDRLPVRFERTMDGFGMMSTAGHRLLRVQAGGTVDVQAQLQGKPANLRLELEGSDSHAAVTGAQALPGRSNYFLGNDHSRWRSGVGQFAQALVKDVYPGIDLVYYGNGNSLEHDFRVAPRSDPGLIRLRVSGGVARVDGASGDLIISNANPELEMMRFRQPVAYQLRSDGSRALIAAAFRKAQDGSFGFSLGSYDRERPLVIDPVIVYGTYFGGSGNDVIQDLKIGPDGGLYFLMTTSSIDLKTLDNPSPTCGPGCGAGSADYYVAKLDNTGHTLVFATYIGGSGSDYAYNLALDRDGNMYVAGISNSTDFPQVNAYPGTATSGSTLSRISADGSQLAYSTYLGAALPGGAGLGFYVYGGSFEPQYMVTANDGIVYLLGWAGSSFIPKNPLFTTGLDFIAKVDTTKSGTDAIVYATPIGTAQKVNPSGPTSLAIDSKGDLWLYGTTFDATFPVTTPDALQPTCHVSKAGDCDSGFLMEINPAGTAVLYSTFLGGTSDTYSLSTYDIRLDPSDNIYVSGSTSEADYPIRNGAYTTLYGRPNNFVSKLSPDGKTLLYSTYLRGGGSFSANYPLIAVSTDQKLAFAGQSSNNFPKKNNLQTSPPSGEFSVDAIFGLIDTTLSGDDSLLISSFLGAPNGASAGNGIGSTVPGHVEFASGGQLIIAGGTAQSDLPIVNPYQPKNSGASDGFIVAIQPANTLTLTPAAITFPPTSLGATSTATASLFNGTTQSIYLKQGMLSDRKDFSQSDDCDGILAPANGCTITFTFTPQSTGTLTSTYTTGDLDDPTHPLTIALTGNGSPASVSLLPAPLDFGPVPDGSMQTLPVTLNNTGSTALTITSATVTGTGFTLASNTCGGSVAASASCQYAITVSPTTLGAYTGALTVVDNNGSQTVQLTARGTAPVISFTPPTLDFGDVAAGSSKALSLTVNNSGGAAIAITTATITGAGFTITSNACGASVAAAGSCQYTITANPITGGAYHGTFNLTDASGTQTVQLTANATAPPTLSRTTLDFGMVPIGTTKSLQAFLGNPEAVAIAITSVTVTGSGFTLDRTQCGTSLAAYATCEIIVDVAPTVTLNGPLNGTLTVVAASGTVTAQLTATGFLPDLLTPSPLAFGNIIPPQNVQRTATFTNAGSQPITITGTTITPELYTVVGSTCPAMVPPQATCTFSIEFASFAYGTTTGTFTVHDGISNPSIALTATGVEGPIPSVTPNAITFPPIANNTSASRAVIVSNAGDTPLSVNGVTFTGTNPAVFNQNNNCTAPLNKAGACTINVVFSPGATGQSFAANMDVKLSTGDVNVALTGTTTGKGDFTVTSPESNWFVTDPASWTINVAPLDASVGWNQPVTFTSDLSPSIGKLTFAPASVTPGANTVSTTVTLADPSAAARAERPLVNLRAGWPVLACCVLFFSLGGKFKSLRGRKLLLLLACIGLGVISLEGCGNPPTVTITVTATSGSVSHTVQLTYQPPS